MPASGSQLAGFRQGWAKAIFGGQRGHFFRRVGAGDVAISACGQEVYVSQLYGIGTFTACRNCRKKHGPPPDVRTFIDTMPPAQLAASPAAQLIAAAIAREDNPK
jgi:hypothetical protein